MNRLAILVGLGGVDDAVSTVVASLAVSWRAVVVAGGVLAALVALSGVVPVALPRRVV